jgi:DNA-binding CsgD family transcriptional regulator
MTIDAGSAHVRSHRSTDARGLALRLALVQPSCNGPPRIRGYVVERRCEQKRDWPRAGAATPELDPPPDLEGFAFSIDCDEYVLLAFPVTGPKAKGASSNGAPRLTRAEQAILSLVLRGQGNSAIAAARGTSPRTIANQLAAIYQKLGVSSRRELGAYARSPSG